MPRRKRESKQSTQPESQPTKAAPESQPTKAAVQAAQVAQAPGTAQAVVVAESATQESQVAELAWDDPARFDLRAAAPSSLTTLASFDIRAEPS